MAEDRVVLHVDMNAFFASVELLDHPELRAQPVAVCGNPENRRGIILAKNEPAKGFGVQTAEPIWQAQRKCPGLVLLQPRKYLYEKYYRLANEIYERYTDLVEPVSIDESYLDVTGSRKLFGDGETIAHSIRRTITEELGLTVSVGVSFCKVFAKLGSDYKKPDAVTTFSRENYQRLLAPLPISVMLNVGAATEEKLHAIGVRTIGQMMALDRTLLVSRCGKQGEQFFKELHGLDDAPVRPPGEQEEAKSIGNAMTFKRDLLTLEDIHAGLLPLAESVGARLRAKGMYCRGVQVTLKDQNLKAIDRQVRLPHATHLTRMLYEAAMALIEREWPHDKPIRMLAITAIQLVGEDADEQLSLFDQPQKQSRLEALDSSLDQIRARFGKRAIRPASILKNDLGIED